MAVESSMLALGTPLPPFALTDTVTGRVVRHEAYVGRPLVVAFLCNHCPYVKHIRSAVAEFGRWAEAHGVGMVAISPNDVTAYPADAPERMAEEAAQAGYVFPYLYDEAQDVARAFDAQCTPEFYLFDATGRLAYRGRLDDSTPRNGRPLTGRDLQAAAEAVLAGRAPEGEQLPSIGCSIKWKA